MFSFAYLNTLFRRRDGAVGVIAAIVLPIAIGVAGMVVEYGHGVLEKIENQRVADLGAYAGAMAYNATGSQTSMTAAANAVATLNGVGASGVAVALVASPVGTAATNAVRVTITTSVPMIFSRILGSGATMAVPAQAFAELRPAVDSCILALSATAGGVALTGGTQLLAPACAVASNAAISVPCGTTLKTVGVSYNSATAPSAPCGGIVGPTGGAATVVKKATPDPLAANTSIVAARARLPIAAALTAPANPAAPLAPTVANPGGTYRDINLGYDDAAAKNQAIAIGCTAAKSGSTWTLTCPAGTHSINNFEVGGGLQAVLSGGTSTIYNFAQPMNTGPAISFGTGIFTFKQGLTIGYGGATFGGGSLSVIGNISTGASGGTATFGSTDVIATGNVSLTGTTNLTGSGILWVGGNLTTAGTPNVAQSQIRVVGNFSVTSPAPFNAVRELSVGGAMSIGTSGNMSFGGGTWSITGGLSAGGSSVITIGAGTFTIGRNASTCNGSQFSICTNAASLIFAGPSSFVLNSGVSAGGGTVLVLGNSGTDNSFRIGAAPNGNAIQVGGGSVLRLGDATGTSSIFQLAGHLNIAAGGGSCTVIGAALQHDISGSILTTGATMLGAGVYTVNGSVGIGANGGGNVLCNGANMGLLANNVSLIIGANGAGLTGSCNEQAFCVAAGYQSVVLTAPSAGDYRRLAVVGPASSSRGVFFTEGAGGTTLSGLLYVPSGSVRFDGGASVGNGAGECLQVIGKDVLLNGGALLASTCVSGSATGGRVVLVR